MTLLDRARRSLRIAAKRLRAIMDREIEPLKWCVCGQCRKARLRKRLNSEAR